MSVIIKIKSYVRKMAKITFLRFLSFLKPEPEKLDVESIRRVLVVRFGGLGDVTVITGLIHALRLKFPCAQIDLMTRRDCEPIVRMNPDINRIKIISDIRFNWSPFHIWRVICEMRSVSCVKYDLAFFTHNDLAAILPALFFRSRQKIGFDTNDSGYDFAFTHSVSIYYNSHPSEDYWKSMNLNQHFHLLLSELIKREINAEMPVLYISAEENNDMAKIILTKGITRPYVVFAVGGTARNKLWPSERYCELAHRIIDDYSYGVVILGDHHDRERMRNFGWPGRNCYMAAGDLTLRESMVVVNLAAGVVGHDTGLMHVAGALSKKCVAMFGPTPSSIYGNINSKQVVLKASDMSCVPCESFVCKYEINCHDYSPCMYNINIESVIHSMMQGDKHESECRGMRQISLS